MGRPGGPRLESLPTAPVEQAKHPISGAPVYIFGHPEPGTVRQGEVSSAQKDALNANLPYPLSEPTVAWIKQNKSTGPLSADPHLRVLVLAAGCFWCSEDLFMRDRSSKPV